MIAMCNRKEEAAQTTKIPILLKHTFPVYTYTIQSSESTLQHMSAAEWTHF